MKNKKIIAVSLSGLFIKSEPWDKAHTIWFEDVSAELGDPSYTEWINKDNYFQGVDQAMQEMYPEKSDEERTEIARKRFFDSVVKYIKKYPNVINRDVIKLFRKIKEKYLLALITTNTHDATARILVELGLQDVFDIIECSAYDEKDDKIAVFERFVAKYGKPNLYIGGSRKDSYEFCHKNKIKCIYANLEDEPEINNVEIVHTLEELKQKIDNL